MISEKKMIKIRQEMIENVSGGWQTKQVMDIIYKKTGIRYHEVHIYSCFTNGDSHQRFLIRDL
jgi:transposase